MKINRFIFVLCVILSNNICGQNNNEEKEDTCYSLTEKISYYMDLYNKKKDSNYVYLTIKQCDFIIDNDCDINSVSFALIYKIKCYELLGLYKEGINELSKLKKNKDINLLLSDDFGYTYCLLKLKILLTNSQGDIAKRNKYIKTLIDFMDICFNLHDYPYCDLQEAINEKKLNESIEDLKFTNADRTSHHTLYKYYIIKCLIYDKKDILNEINNLKINYKDYLYNEIKTFDENIFYNHFVIMKRKE
jgi:hypothetical protein